MPNIPLMTLGKIKACVMRKCAASAPPTNPVTKIAPNTAARDCVKHIADEGERGYRKQGCLAPTVRCHIDLEQLRVKQSNQPVDNHDNRDSCTQHDPEATGNCFTAIIAPLLHMEILALFARWSEPLERAIDFPLRRIFPLHLIPAIPIFK